MTRRSALLLSLIFGMPAIALSLIYGHDVRVAYHRYEMERHYKAAYETVSDMGGGLAGYELGDSYQKFEHHRDKLVKLGVLDANVYVLRFLIGGTHERRHFWRLICGAECPPNVEVVGDPQVAGQPWKITVWCWPDSSAKWDEYIAKRDTAAYRDEFMPHDATAL